MNLKEALKQGKLVTVLHGEDNRLATCAAAALAGPRSANISFICLNIAIKRALPIDLTEMLADLMRHTQSSVIAYCCNASDCTKIMTEDRAVNMIGVWNGCMAAAPKLRRGQAWARAPVGTREIDLG